MTKAEKEALETKGKAQEERDLTILEAIELSKKEKFFKRRAWSKHLKSALTTKRGETLPVIVVGKHSTPYQPSIEDVISDDWYEVKGAK